MHINTGKLAHPVDFSQIVIRQRKLVIQKQHLFNQIVIRRPVIGIFEELQGLIRVNLRQKIFRENFRQRGLVQEIIGLHAFRHRYLGLLDIAFYFPERRQVKRQRL